MRPALQRLLTRPSSLEFLKVLVEQQPTNRLVLQQSGLSARSLSGLARAPNKDGGFESCVGNGKAAKRREVGQAKYQPKSNRRTKPHVVEKGLDRERKSHLSVPDISAPNVERPTHILVESTDPQPWIADPWSRGRLEFESDMESLDSKRLINQSPHSLNLDLWLYLLEYRRNQHGDAGVFMFWDAIFRNGIQLPTSGKNADNLWQALLDLDFTALSPECLERICTYADLLDDKHSAKWPDLYFHIIRHFLVAGKHKDAMVWHRRLDDRHGNGEGDFLRLFQEVLEKGKSQRGLMEIYAGGKYHSCYDTIIPGLCAREEYQKAIEWHFLLVQQNDLPTSPTIVQTFLDNLRTYSPRCAAKVIQSLQTAKPNFESTISYTPVRITPKSSVDLVAEVRSKTFHVSEKPYNDSLGARWLATKWITLDTAIKTIDALGVKEIGALSVQSIALRERDAEAIAYRIEQLTSMGISIGTASYSLAIARFSRDNKQDLLNLMLESDQHPSELDNQKLQEQLLYQYAKSKQWKLFRLSLEILSLRANNPQTQKRNILFRLSLNGETPATVENIRENIRDMIHDDIPIKYDTIVEIKNAVLQERRKGHKPVTKAEMSPGKQLDECVSLLLQIAKSNFVPIHLWTEIVRRLGMLGHFQALEDVCAIITGVYSPTSLQLRLARVPSEVTTNNPAHPLRQFFTESLQMAIVEWGFMHTLDGRTLTQGDGKPPITINSGIRLLKSLSEKGVWICHESIRKAILNRLLIYYGPGESNRRYNRAARERLKLSLPEMVASIEYDLVDQALSDSSVQALVDAHGYERIGNRNKQAVERNAKGLARNGQFHHLL